MKSELTRMRLLSDTCEGPAGELGGKAIHRAYCVLHSETQRRKDLELAAEVRSSRLPAAPACQCSSDVPDLCCYTKADESAFLNSCRRPAKKTICAVQAFNASACANSDQGGTGDGHTSTAACRQHENRDILKAVLSGTQGGAQKRKEGKRVAKEEAAQQAAIRALAGREAHWDTLERARLELESLRMLLERVGRREKVKKQRASLPAQTA